MDKAMILKCLQDVRDTQFSCWASYCEYKDEYPGSKWPYSLINNADMNVRVLDYVMEAIRRNDTV